MKEKNTTQEDYSQDFVYTQDYLKRTTEIHGWLIFFCFSIVVGGFLSAIVPIATFNIDDYGGNYELAAMDIISEIILGILLLMLAIMAVVALRRRDGDAIFLAQTYNISCFAYNLMSLLICSNDSMVGNNQIFLNLMWFLYLCNSRQVKEVIPPEYRKTEKRDWYFIGSLVVAFVMQYLFVFLAYKTVQDARDTTDKEAAAYAEIPLKFGELTDGRMIFTRPKGFTSSDTYVEQENEGRRIFLLENEDTKIILFSTRAKDQDMAAYIGNKFIADFEKKNMEIIDSITGKFHTSVILSERRTLKDYKYIYKVDKYETDDNVVYARLIVLFDSSSKKICCISSITFTEDDSYLMEFIKSIKFIK